MITALLFSVMTGSVALQPDDGWLAWQGCWRSVDDDMTSLMCIVPEGNGVRMITLVDGTKRSEVMLIADGVARPISQEGCSGTQQASWSSDRQRLFLKTNMSCGETVQRNVAGIMSMPSANEWLSIHAVTAGNNTSTQVERYRAIEVAELPSDIAGPLRANRLARETARHASSAVVDLEDVQEAASIAQTPATVTWLSAMEQEFDLDGKKLIALADAGVPADVIDALVAVSNPYHFAMDARRDDDYERRYPTSRCYDRYYDPWYGYGDCGRYSGWGRGYGGWGYYGTPVIIVRGRDTENPAAKVTRKGYKKGGSDNGTTTTSSTPSSSKPSSSGSSGSDDKDKSSGSSSGRTAKPRGT